MSGAVSGCAHLAGSRALTAPQPLPADIAAYYDYPSHTHQATIEPIATHRAYREFLVRFPLSVKDFEPTEPVVEFEWYESTRSGRRAAILFNPILGGDYPLERGVCRYLARHGFHVALVHRKTLKISPDRDVAHIELLLRQGVLRIRQIVDWMEVNDRVDAHRMGSFGISMGGIAGVMTAAVEPRLRVHVVALAGGGIAEIICNSHDKLLTKPRTRYLTHNHMDLSTLRRRLHEEIKTDPIRLAPYVDGRHLFMFIALADRTIGRENAFRLWKALGRPEVSLLPLGHYTSYLILPYLKWRSCRFFERELAPST
ncbi:MAG: hypothetical protein HY352_03945 [Candidatus Omnitrophica bacterium]|nr:hypothetical protein [Candidatus Omnitrophota bacterium]